MAVYDLNEVFAQLHRQVRVKRGSLFSLDDAQNNNLIFVGSPAENLSLRDIPSTHHFIFQRATSGPRKGDLAIFNVDPRPDEPKMFFASPSGTPLTEDYAIVTRIVNWNSGDSPMLSVAGMGGYGTLAAADFICNPAAISDMAHNLPEHWQSRNLQLILHVKVVDFKVAATEVVAVHTW